MPRLSPEGYEGEIRELRDRVNLLQYQNGSEARRLGAEAMLDLLISKARSRTDACVTEVFLEAARYDLISEATATARAK